MPIEPRSLWKVQYTHRVQNAQPMCGFAGFVSRHNTSAPDEMRQIAARMASALVHRGPDAAGEWVDPESGIALGFRRLSVVDLTPAGHQPMLSASGRFVIVFNGEVYNHEAVRSELISANVAPGFRGHSDTEVVLAAIDAWGLDVAVERFIGMFAFAIWDRLDRQLYLVRDRIGVKPLYYGWAGDTFLFGSELKAVRRHPAFRDELDRQSLASFMRYGNVPAPHTIYRDVRKLLPGTILKVNPCARSAVTRTYWAVRNVVEAGIAEPYRGTFADAIDDLNELLRDAIALRMVADVPLGVLLSGGVDSSLVAALMSEQSPGRVKTFSIGFLEDRFNEAHHARSVAHYLGTDHTECYLTAADVLAVVPRLPQIFDEPFADSSQIPTLLVSELARRHVTVALSGDGGDELFGGYARYFAVRNIWNRVGWLPPRMRASLGGWITRAAPDVRDRSGRVVRTALHRSLGGSRVRNLAQLLASRDPHDAYRNLVWKSAGEVVIGASEHPQACMVAERLLPVEDIMLCMMQLDTIAYLPDDILVKVDRASMAASLEAREPLLDHRIVEFAWRLPLSIRVGDGTGKRVLKEVLYRYVPREMIERPKMGFGVPLAQWLRGPLRDWAEDLLDAERLQAEGLLNPFIVRDLWGEHLGASRDNSTQLWPILMFQAWLRDGSAAK